MKKIKFEKLNLSQEDILGREQLKYVLGGEGGYEEGSGGGCKDECVREMTCVYGGNPNGKCTKTKTCNGTDGKVYLVLYCTAN